jgi:hypothetical protein
MTNIVKKGTNRPAAIARKKKHDQRTPLPPKEAPRKRTVAEIKEQHAAAAEEIGSSKGKAAKFIAYAKEHGWDAGIAQDGDGDRVMAIAQRKDERYDEAIRLTWVNGTLDPSRDDGATYECNGRTIKLRNASAARKHIDGSRMLPREVSRARQPRVRRISSPDGEGREVHIDMSAPPGERVEDQGVLEGRYRCRFSDGSVRYYDKLPVGYMPHYPSTHLVAKRRGKVEEMDITDAYGYPAERKAMYESLGFAATLTRNPDCPGCDTFGCRETRPGAWDGPAIPIKKVVKKKAPVKKAPPTRSLKGLLP